MALPEKSQLSASDRVLDQYRSGVRAVEIPKPHGAGTRILGVPGPDDRGSADRLRCGVRVTSGLCLADQRLTRIEPGHARESSEVRVG